MARMYSKQNGFVLILALGFLAVMTILVLSTMVGTIQSEKMSGSHMQRNRSFQAAERALRYGELFLRQHSEKCSSPSCKKGDSGFATKSGLGSSISEAKFKTLEKFPQSSSDDDFDAVYDYTPPAPSASDKTTETAYSMLINHLEITPDGGKKDCVPYSIMGRGKGAGDNTASETVLQTVVFLCPQ